MAIFANNISFMDQTTSSTHLIVKGNQNLILDVDESKYTIVVQPSIVCLKHSVLRKALTHYSKVPTSALILAYTSANYNTVKDVMNFEVLGHKTYITKSGFCKLLGLRTGEGFLNMELSDPISIIKVYLQLG